MVLRRDLDCARGQALHGMIGAPVAELELVSLATESNAEHLMPETDTEYRHIRIDKLFRIGDTVRQRGRIAGPVAQNNPIRLSRQQVAGRRRCRENAHTAAVRRKAP